MNRRAEGLTLMDVLLGIGLLFAGIFMVCAVAVNVSYDKPRLINALTSATVTVASSDTPNLPTTITTDSQYDGLMRRYRPAGYLHHKLGDVHASQFAFSQRLEDGSWQAEIPAVAGTELLLLVEWPNAADPTETLEFLVHASPILGGLPRYRLWYGGSSASQPAGTE